MEIKKMNQRMLHNRFQAFLPSSLLLAVVVTGCTVGPNYKRPAVNVPTVYRQPGEDTTAAKPEANAPLGTPAGTAQSSATSLGDEKWWEVFQDKDLQGLIRTALKNNYDVRIAATRVVQAQAQLGITRADQLPSVSAGGAVTSQQSSKALSLPLR
jgi:multidrug efflux system outer membrane protein